MNKTYPAPLRKDAYKVFHPFAYNPDVTHVYSNMTPRFGKHSNVPSNPFMVALGLQAFLIEMAEAWEEFFATPKSEAVHQYSRIVDSMLGKHVDTTHMEALHDLGYLPIKVKALPEGSLVPYGVPIYTIVNTVAGFGWVTNMLETDMSAETWGMCTSATTAFAYRQRFEKVKALKEGGMIKFMGHDFSYRGMFGRDAAAKSGFGHLTSFVGSDTIPAAIFAEKYYGADVEKELVFASVDATEHSVMCSYGTDNELESLRHLMEDVTPEGIVSIVSDTWDFWKLVTEYLPALKDNIMARKGTVVIRPDSGDPVDILCGLGTYIEVPRGEFKQGDNDDWYYKFFNQYKDVEYAKLNGTYHKLHRDAYNEVVTVLATEIPEYEIKGLVECLWDTFGGTVVNGQKLLDSHIGAIYGDSITLVRQDQIIKRLEAKGFVPSVVLGIGSFTYQYVTRDTHGTAVKATDTQHGEGNHVPIFKDPKTDSSKKSAKGLLMVIDEGGYKLVSDVTPKEEASSINCLRTVFEDGKLVQRTTLAEIRARIDANFE